MHLVNTFAGLTRVCVLSVVVMLAGMLTGCSTYVTPGHAAPLSTLDVQDIDIREAYQRKPQANFPAHVVAVRIQSSNYNTYSSNSNAAARYVVISTRDVEKDEQYQRLRGMPMVAGLGTLNRMLLPDRLNSSRDLRVAAAQVKADMLIVYTFDTQFNVKGNPIAPLTTVTLGLFADQEAQIHCTASAVIYDVRSGYIHGLAEASSQVRKGASVWNKSDVIDEAKNNAESEAFEKLVGEIEKTWQGIVAANRPAQK